VHVAQRVRPLFLADMPEIVGIEGPDIADVAVRGIGRDGFSFGVLRLDLPGPLLLVVEGEFADDIFETDVAGEVDEVPDRRPPGFSQAACWFGDL
jgi:hypothetical protein